MPRRKSSTSITAAIGKRINLIRKQRGLTLARVGLQDEDDRGNLKGHLSNIERGLVAPTVPTLVSYRGDSPAQSDLTPPALRMAAPKA